MSASVCSADGSTCISVVEVTTKKTHIFFPKTNQEPKDYYTKALDRGFKYIDDIADAINYLGWSPIDEKQKPRRIIVKPSSINDLEKSLKDCDTECIMWGDHSGSPPKDDNGVTTIEYSDNVEGRDFAILTARGGTTKIHVDYDDGRESNYDPIDPAKVSGRLKNENSIIPIHDGIKLINYGCFGNIKHNRERFEAVFRVNAKNNYVGKYRKRAGSQEVTLDMIYDLIGIAKVYAEKLSATKKQLKETFDQLKNIFQETLEGMQKTSYIDPKNKELRRKINEIQVALNEKLKV
jgi:hypothetical protein